LLKERRFSDIDLLYSAFAPSMERLLQKLTIKKDEDEVEKYLKERAQGSKGKEQEHFSAISWVTFVKVTSKLIPLLHGSAFGTFM
jgi:hypothetical protein